MMTLEQIQASIEAIQPAPAGESMEQIARRAAHWILTTIADEHEAIAMTTSLYERAVAGDMPLPVEWQTNIGALNIARAHALDLDLDLDLALDLAHARALDLALDLAHTHARALDLAHARALDLDQMLIALLGDRLQPMPDLHIQVARAVQAGSLRMNSWHTCGTEHCRGGWAITLHPLGADLERYFGPEWAARVIYKVSTGMVPDFFASNEAAMADIRACAAAAQA